MTAYSQIYGLISQTTKQWPESEAKVEQINRHMTLLANSLSNDPLVVPSLWYISAGEKGSFWTAKNQNFFWELLIKLILQKSVWSKIRVIYSLIELRLNLSCYAPVWAG